MARVVFSLGVVVAFVAPTFGQEGRLQKVHDEVHTTSCDFREKSKKKDCDDDDEGCSILGAIFGAMLQAFFHDLFSSEEADGQSPSSDHRYAFFLPHPYARGWPGYLQFRPIVQDENDSQVFKVKPWAIQIAVENGNDFSGLNRVGAQILIDTNSRFGLSTTWHDFYECLPGGRGDELVLGDINVLYRLIQSERVTGRIGIGARMLFHRCYADAGFNFTVGGDVFPVKPVVLSGAIDVGNIGDAFLFHGRATIGIIRSHFEIYTGYDYFQIGSVPLQGPLVGLRFWF